MLPEYNLRWARFFGREAPEQLSSDRVNENRSAGGGGGDHAKLGANGSECDFRIVADKSRARRRVVVDIRRVADDALSPPVPVPKQQRRVFRTGDDVAIAT